MTHVLSEWSRFFSLAVPFESVARTTAQLEMELEPGMARVTLGGGVMEGGEGDPSVNLLRTPGTPRFRTF